MPPSTATQVETLRLTLSTVYSVTAEFATSERPGSISRRRPRAERVAGRRSTSVADVVGDRGRLPGPRCTRRRARRRGRTPATRRAPRAPRSRAERRRASSSCEPMWQCSPTQLEVRRRRRRARSPPAPRPAPNAELRVGLAGGDLLVGVAATRPGVTRIRTRLGAPAALGRAALEAVDLVEVVDHDVADARVERDSQLGASTWRCRADRCAPGRSRP